MEKKTVYTMNLCMLNNYEDKVEYNMEKKNIASEEVKINITSNDKSNTTFLPIVNKLKEQITYSPELESSEEELVSIAYVLDYYNIKYELRYYITKNKDSLYDVKIKLFEENNLIEKEIYSSNSNREISIENVCKFSRNFVFPSNLKEEVLEQ